MVQPRKKTVALLFAGGATLIDREGNVRAVATARTMRAWLANVPELSLVATIKPRFLSGNDTPPYAPELWESLVASIRSLYASVDGFVITQPVDAIPYSAAALSLMARGGGKPIILTGAPDVSPKSKLSRTLVSLWRKSNDLGIRANLVNAVQVATLDLGEVAVLFGNSLVRGSTVVRRHDPSLNMYESAGVQPLGRLDFGMTLASHRMHRSSARPEWTMKLPTKVLHMVYAPGVPALPVNDIDPRGFDGVFVVNQLGTDAPWEDALVAFARRHDLPIIIYRQGQERSRSNDVVNVSGLTPTMAYIKTLWALTMTSTPRRLQALLDDDIVGEHLTGS